MSWTAFYLGCFLFGFALAILVWMTGPGHFHLHLPFHIHLPFHLHLPHGAGHAGKPTTAAGGLAFAVFLAWFGGAGYLMARTGRIWVGLVAGGALLAGLLGAALILGFVGRVLLAHEQELDVADFDMVGVLARVNVPIRVGGTGEIVYSQGGTRRSSGARSEDGGRIAKNAEVIVTKYENGIAYVRCWEELAQGRSR